MAGRTVATIASPMLYAPETFTDSEADRLRPYFTNLDAPVFALTNLPEVVKGALFARYSRDLGVLIALLERLDAHSLAEQRRITIPFVRGLIDSAESAR